MTTTALKVDQSNTSVHNVDQKNTGLGVPLQIQVPMAASSNTGKGGSNHDHHQSSDLTSSTTEAGNIAPTTVTLMQKKSVLLAKVPADKKRIDARKKSLKRL